MTDKNFWLDLQLGEEIRLEGMTGRYGASIVRDGKYWRIVSLKAEEDQEMEDFIAHVQSLVDGVNSFLSLVGFKIVFNRALEEGDNVNVECQGYFKGEDTDYPSWDEFEKLACLVYVVEVAVEDQETIFNHISRGDEFMEREGNDRYMKLEGERKGSPYAVFYACRMNGEKRGELINPPPYDMPIKKVVRPSK